MKRDVFIFLMASTLMSVCALADNARFRICVVDERTNEPLRGMRIKGVFIERHSNWTRPVVDNEFVGETGREGVFEAKGETNCGEAVFLLEGNSGFYDTPRIRVPFDSREGRPTTLSRWWKPDNPVIAIALQRIERPTPLFVKYVELRDYKKGIGWFDGTNSVLRFDMMRGDWLPPYGHGEIADVTIASKVTVTGTGKSRKPYPEFGWETMNFYELKGEVVFSGSDGISERAAKPTDGLKIRCVWDELVGKRVARVSGVRQIFERKGGDWYAEGFSDKNADRAYAFRIRSRCNEKGELVEAYYGKVYGDFEFEGDDRRGLVGMKFLYYLNPSPLDRNLEWDMRNNLCPDSGSLGERRP